MTEHDTTLLHGLVPVDSAHLLIVDPCHLSGDLLARLVAPNEYGVTVGVVVPTIHGDGAFPVYTDAEAECLVIEQ